MEDPDPKIRGQLRSGFQLFNRKEYAQCRKLLKDINLTHISVELNSLLCEYKQNPNKVGQIMKKMMDILTIRNIELYKERTQYPYPEQTNDLIKAPRIKHEMYYWNLIVLAQLMNNLECGQLLANEAIHYIDSLRTQTSLMLLYHLLKNNEGSSRLAYCISLIEKQNNLLFFVRKLQKSQQMYRFLNQILFNKVLLKFGMLDDSKTMFMMKFNQSPQEFKEENDLMQINGIPTFVYQKLLHAEIEFHSNNYNQTYKYLSELLPIIEKLGPKEEYIKSLIDHNIAIVLCNSKKATAGQSLIKNSLDYLMNAKQMHLNNEKSDLVNKCRENMLLSALLNPNGNYKAMYEAHKTFSTSYSYKINYRKAQLCLNYYHELLKNPEKTVLYSDIYDNYETVYYHPNQPYFQQKGKNKNPNFTSGKLSYRRYVLPEKETTFLKTYYEPVKEEEFPLYNHLEKNQSKKESIKDNKKTSSKQKKNNKKIEEEEPLKEEAKEPATSYKKVVKDPRGLHLLEVLDLATWHLRLAINVLEREKNVIVNLQGEEKGLTKQVNEKLYKDYIAYKGSIYELLCYSHLCKKEWLKTIEYAEAYDAFQKHYLLTADGHKQNKATAYNIITYKIEALAELQKARLSFDCFKIANTLVNSADRHCIEVRSTYSQQPGMIYFEKMTPFMNMYYNLSALQCKNNNIPESYNSINKTLQQLRGSSSNEQTNLPDSMLDIMIYYNLRTSNVPSAIQLMKRRRILGIPGMVNTYQPTLNITK